GRRQGSRLDASEIAAQPFLIAARDRVQDLLPPQELRLEGVGEEERLAQRRRHAGRAGAERAAARRPEDEDWHGAALEYSELRVLFQAAVGDRIAGGADRAHERRQRVLGQGAV